MRCPEKYKDVSDNRCYNLCFTYIAHIYSRIFQASLVGQNKVRELGNIQLGVSVGIEEFPHLVSHQPAHTEEQKLASGNLEVAVELFDDLSYLQSHHNIEPFNDQIIS